MAPDQPAPAPPSSDPFAGWSEQDLEARTRRLLGKQGAFRPTVRLIEQGDRRWVAKDYRACTPLYRWTAGAWNLARELAALGRLSGLDGVPAIEGRIGRWIVLLTWFRGHDLGKTPKETQTEAFFDALAEMVQAMHSRGVVHLDLRQRRNLLVRPDGRPAIIDFGASLCVRPGGFLLRLLAPVDTSGVLKYKRRAQPGTLTDGEARALRKVERRRRWWPFS